MAKLNMIHGLFEVVDGIYQARGYDLSVMSIIRSNTGYIVLDPFVSRRRSVERFSLLRRAYGHHRDL